MNILAKDLQGDRPIADTEERPSSPPVFVSPCLCRWSSTEALGYILEASGKGFFTYSLVQLTPSFIYFGSIEANCGPVYDAATCTGVSRLGLKPGALVSFFTMLGQVCASLTILLVPSIADYSSLRWTLGVSSAACLIFVEVVFCFISKETWFAIGILTATIALPLYVSQEALANTYISQLTSDHTVELPKVMATARVAEILTLLGFGATMLIVDSALRRSPAGLNPVESTRIAIPIAVVGLSVFFTLGWSRLGRRGAAKVLPPGQSLLFVGLRHLSGLVREVRDKHPHTAKFLAAYAFWQAACTNTVTLLLSYVLSVLSFTSAEYNAVGVLAIVCALFGAAASAQLSLLLGKKHTLAASLVSSMGCIFLVVCTAFKPSSASVNLIFIYSIFLGFSLGVYIPAQRSIYAELMPAGREGSFIGLFAFCSQVISWAPSLIYTVVFQFGRGALGARLALCSIVLFYSVGLLGLWGFDFDAAKSEAQKSDYGIELQANVDLHATQNNPHLI